MKALDTAHGQVGGPQAQSIQRMGSSWGELFRTNGGGGAGGRKPRAAARLRKKSRQ